MWLATGTGPKMGIHRFVTISGRLCHKRFSGCAAGKAGYFRASSFKATICITSDSAISAESANLVGETKVEPSD
jgi:hypothetical protein